MPPRHTERWKTRLLQSRHRSENQTFEKRGRKTVIVKGNVIAYSEDRPHYVIATARAARRGAIQKRFAIASAGKRPSLSLMPTHPISLSGSANTLTSIPADWSSPLTDSLSASRMNILPALSDEYVFPGAAEGAEGSSAVSKEFRACLRPKSHAKTTKTIIANTAAIWFFLSFMLILIYEELRCMQCRQSYARVKQPRT